MPQHENDNFNDSQGSPVDIRFFGKFILWAVIASVGWSFYSTMSHDKSIAVIEQELGHLTDKIYIDQKLSRIEKKIDKLKR